MRIATFLFSAVLFAFTQILPAQQPNNLEGDWSGAWNINNPLTERGPIRYARVQAGVTGNRDFLFNDGPGDYNPEFKLKFSLTNPQALNTRIFNPLSAPGNNIQFPAITGNWYMMIVEVATNDNDLSIIELASQPILLDTVVRCPMLPTSTATVDIRVPASVTPGAGEQLWVHYSTDGFATSAFVQLTGNPLTATIPALPNGTSVSYYLLTTNNSITLNANDVDYQAIDMRFQGDTYGNYFSYTVDDANGTIGTPCFIFPTEEICSDGEDNDGNGLVDGFDPDCGLCTGTLGDNVFPEGSFGTISADGQHPTLQSTPAVNPGLVLGNELPAGVTTYTYGLSGDFSCLFDSLCFPDDGNYVITNTTRGMMNPPASSHNWILTEDNGPEPDGYMMVVNAAPSVGVFYQFEINGLCPGTVYEFSADVINLVMPDSTGFIPPNIDFIIADSGASLLDLQTAPAAGNTGNVPQDSVWHSYGFTFFPPGTSVTLALRNNNPGGQNNIGNDLAIDNISFRPCGPSVTTLNPGVFCAGNTVFFDATVSGGYNNPQYQWQYSNDGGQTWTDIAGATSEDYTFTSSANSDSGYYRLLVAEMGNIQDSLCRITANPVYLQLQCPLESVAESEISSQAKIQDILVTPNPTTGLADIHLFSPEKQLIRVSMRDMLGKNVWETRFQAEAGKQQMHVNWQHLPAGIYGLHIEINEGSFSKKVILY